MRFQEENDEESCTVPWERVGSPETDDESCTVSWAVRPFPSMDAMAMRSVVTQREEAQEEDEREREKNLPMNAKPSDAWMVGAISSTYTLKSIATEVDDEMAKTSSRFLPAQSGLPSIGAVLHATGDCRPCAWFYKPQGCHHGEKCGHCHLCPDGELKQRRKQKIAVMKSSSQVSSAKGAPRSPTGSSSKGAAFESEEGAPTGFLSGVPAFWLRPWAPSFLIAASSAKDGDSGLQQLLPSLAPASVPLPDSPVPLMKTASAPAASGGEAVIVPRSRSSGTSRPTLQTKLLGPGGPAVLEQAQHSNAMGKSHSASPGSQPLQVKSARTPSPPQTPAKGTKSSGNNAVANGLPSVGSALHRLGECKPCAWYWKPQGCTNGSECRHCHLCPKGEVKARKRNAVMSHTATAPATSSQTMRPLMAEPHLAGMFPPPPAGLYYDPIAYANTVAHVASAAAASEHMLGQSGWPFPGNMHDPALLSAGSAMHGQGKCRPCSWVWTPAGCHKGQECNYCHICGTGRGHRLRKVSSQHPNTRQ